ncbi:LptF/LptG family permease [Marinimicrococcus flavescens]|uniref:LptF/LptG family permease n=1 Tax=Marinimicrococcus flavescens TaxID=3031815 RepID=A0AAP3XQD9_9PROT|nr:LptF/LptG family permease [Marinimicrococcus flavescens]
MKIYDRYITGQIVRPMLAIVLIALAALLAERMLRVVDIVVGWRGSLVVIVEMLGYLIPHYMSLALPASFFIAILVVFGRLSRDGELDAMMASGLGLHRLLQPLLKVGLALLVITAITQSYLQPFSRYAYRAALFTLSNVSFQALLRERLFVTLGSTTYSVEGLSEDRSSFEGLLLHDDRGGGRSVTITAQEGRVVPPQNNEPLTLELSDGVQQFVPETGEAGKAPEGGATVRFRNFTSDLQGNQPGTFRPRGEDERELTLPELWAGLSTPVEGIDDVEIESEFHGRVVRILSALTLPLVALPLAIARRRARRSYGMVIGIALLVAYNQVLQVGEGLADNGRISSWLALWVPFGLFALIGLLLTWSKTTRVPAGSGTSWLDDLLERAGERFERLVSIRLGRS